MEDGGEAYLEELTWRWEITEAEDRGQRMRSVSRKPGILSAGEVMDLRLDICMSRQRDLLRLGLRQVVEEAGELKFRGEVWVWVRRLSAAGWFERMLPSEVDQSE